MAITLDDIASTLDGTDPQVTVSTGGSTPRAVVGFMVIASATDTLTSMQYPVSSVGANLNAVTGSPFSDSDGTPSTTIHIRLLNGIDGGQQTLDCANSGAAFKVTAAVTLNAAADVELQGTATIDQALAAIGTSESTTTLSLGGNSCYCLQGWRAQNGNLAFRTELTNWSNQQEFDAGNSTGGLWTYDLIGTSDVTAGMEITTTTQDIVVVVAAFRESGGAAAASLLPTSRYQSAAMRVLLTR